jgi:hypothetical protein
VSIDLIDLSKESSSFKKTVIPQKNHEHSINVKDYRIEVVPVAALDSYFKEWFVQEPALKVPV